jgi:hypothetical protein
MKDHVMKTYRVGGIAPHILDLSFVPWLIYSWGKSPHYPLDRKLGWPQRQSECDGEEKIPRTHQESNP